MDNADHAWIAVGDGGVLHIHWSDKSDWEDRMKKPKGCGLWQLVLSPKIRAGEVVILLGHLVEFQEVKKLLGDDFSYDFFGHNVFSKSEEPLKKIAEEFVFSEKNYKVIPEKTTGSLWWKETEPKCWKVFRHFVCKREQEVEVTDLATADRYIITEKEVVR
jgi:hypothetical protein